MSFNFAELNQTLDQAESSLTTYSVYKDTKGTVIFVSLVLLGILVYGALKK